MKIGKNLLNFFFSGYAHGLAGGRVVFKTIVSSDNELRCLLMNLEESLENVDYFLVCEANYNVLGEKRDYIFGKYFESMAELQNEKIIYVMEDISSTVRPWEGSKENLFSNAFDIRDSIVTGKQIGRAHV